MEKSLGSKRGVRTITKHLTYHSKKGTVKVHVGFKLSRAGGKTVSEPSERGWGATLKRERGKPPSFKKSKGRCRENKKRSVVAKEKV